MVQFDPARLLNSVGGSAAAVISEMQKTCDDLKTELQELPFCDPQVQYLQSWIDCIGPPDLTEFPAELLENTLDCSNESLRLLDLPTKYKPPLTPANINSQWSDLAPQQTPPSDFYPSRVEHLLAPSALQPMGETFND